MKQKANNYEEAKIILKKAPEEEIARHNERIHKYRMKLVTAIMTSVAIAAGIATDNPMTTVCLIPSVGIATLSAFLPYRKYMKSVDKIKDGSFFEDKTEEEVIERANKYVDSYNSLIDVLKEEEKGRRI